MLLLLTSEKLGCYRMESIRWSVFSLVLVEVPPV